MDSDDIARLLAGYRPEPSKGGASPRRAAVALVLDPTARLLFILRTVQEGDPWSGQMGFPGGMKEPGDPDTLATAIRETREEVGLDLSVHARLLAELDPRPVVRPVRDPFVVQPYVFALLGPVSSLPGGLVPSVDEVQSVFWFPIQELATHERSTLLYHWNGAQVELPCIRFQGQCIWGLSLRMLENLLEALGLGSPSRLHPPAPGSTSTSTPSPS